jgi:hypothetical protein
MRMSNIVLVAATLSIAAASAYAGPKPQPQVHAPVAPTSHPPAPTTHEHQHSTGSPTHDHPDATAPRTHETTDGHTRKATASAPGTAGATTTPTTPALNPIAQKILANRGLQPKVRALLPAGMTLNQASLGFKNQGQFLAALHVSHNLGIPFADLKTAMTGVRPTTTGAPGGTTAGTTATPPTLSLGQAIHKLRPSADTVTATTTAERQASAELSITVPTTASTTTTSKKKDGK